MSTQAKPTPKATRTFQAEGERFLPVRYLGETIRIGKDPVQFVWDDLPYDSKIHIQTALDNKEITEVSAAAPVSKPAVAEKELK